jgi:hypothetical protein
VLIDPAERDWSTEDDSTVWHAAGDGIPQAKAELRRRETQHRVGRAKAAMVSRARNGRS